MKNKQHSVLLTSEIKTQLEEIKSLFLQKGIRRSIASLVIEILHKSLPGFKAEALK